jgi:hypothetical protein
MNRLTLGSGLAVATVLRLWRLPLDTGDGATVFSGTAGIDGGSIADSRFPRRLVSAPRPPVGARGSKESITSSRSSRQTVRFRCIATSRVAARSRAPSPKSAAGETAARGAQPRKVRISPAGGSGKLCSGRGKFLRRDGNAALALRELALTGRSISIAGRNAVPRGVNIGQRTRASIASNPAGRLAGTDAAGCRISARLTRIRDLGVVDVRMPLGGALACRTTLGEWPFRHP